MLIDYFEVYLLINKEYFFSQMVMRLILSKQSE